MRIDRMLHLSVAAMVAGACLGVVAAVLFVFGDGVDPNFDEWDET